MTPSVNHPRHPTSASAWSGRSGLRARAACWAGAALLLGACDGVVPTGADEARVGAAQAPAPPRATAIAVSVRVESAGSGPSASLLAFHADATWMDRLDVLSIVDPLLVAPPQAGCVVRAVDEEAARLRAQDAWVELESLGALTLSFDDGARVRPVPRVFPDQSGIAAGIVDEAGPHDLAAEPRRMQLRFASGDELLVELPEFPRALLSDGNPLTPGQALFARGEQRISLVGPAESFIELRPFGTTEWLACAAEVDPADGETRVRLPAAALQRVAALARGVPVSFDVVWRREHVLGLSQGKGPAHLWVELRGSTLIGLVP